MEAKRIPGKPAKTKRERIEGLLTFFRDVSSSGDLIRKREVLDILDSPTRNPSLT